MPPQTHRQALPEGFMLQEYQLGRVLGQGGFGLTYLGWDTALDKAVAVKEYLPNELAVREANHSVAAKSGGDEDNFKWGLSRVLFEARTLARFKHPNIVPVYRCFEAHGTAYIVMEFVEGETFDAYLKRAGRPKESFLRDVLTALLDGLAEVHRAGFMHRDIKPGNIILNTEGAPVLVDFGSARQEVGGKSRSITSVVTPGYAPIEQYSTRGNQGPWTDIYALGAVAYRAVTGEAPPDATERVLDDSMGPAVDAGSDKYSAEFLRAIDQALAVDAKNRLQDVDAWRRALVSDAPAKKPATGKPKSKPKQDGQCEERWADGTVANGQCSDGKKRGQWVEQAAFLGAVDWARADNPAAGKPEVKSEVKWKVESKSGVGWAAAIIGVLIVGGLVAEWDGQRREEAEMARGDAIFREFLSRGYSATAERRRREGKKTISEDEFLSQFNSASADMRSTVIKVMARDLYERDYKDNPKVTYEKLRRVISEHDPGAR